MDEEAFNMGLRKFLKRVGVTSQREIEAAVRQAIADGRLVGDETLIPVATIRVGDIDLEIEVDGELPLS